MLTFKSYEGLLIHSFELYCTYLYCRPTTTIAMQRARVNTFGIISCCFLFFRCSGVSSANLFFKFSMFQIYLLQSIQPLFVYIQECKLSERTDKAYSMKLSFRHWYSINCTQIILTVKLRQVMRENSLAEIRVTFLIIIIIRKKANYECLWVSNSYKKRNETVF